MVCSGTALLFTVRTCRRWKVELIYNYRSRRRRDAGRSKDRYIRNGPIKQAVTQVNIGTYNVSNMIYE
jgi:hypothetical protein